MRDWHHAVEALTKAIALDPADPVNLNNRCYAYNMSRAYDDAIKDCLEGPRARFRNTPLPSSPRQRLLEQGRLRSCHRQTTAMPSRSIPSGLDVDGARQRQHQERQPRRRDCRLWRSDQLDRVAGPGLERALLGARHQGQDPAELDLALADCDKPLAIQTNDAAIFDSRALAYLKLGKLDQSITDYDQALELDPKMATSLYGEESPKLARRRPTPLASRISPMPSARP